MGESSAKNTCFKRTQVRICAFLTPERLNNVDEGVRLLLDEYLMKYHDDLKGVVLAYEKVQLLEKKGRIIADMPYIHLRVKVSFLLFAPAVGSRLVGHAHKVGSDHIGLLVDGIFNVSIPREYIHSDFTFDALKDAWTDSTSETPLQVAEGTNVLFEVVSLETKSDILSMTAKMLEDKTETVLEGEAKSKKSKKSHKSKGEPEPEKGSKKAAKRKTDEAEEDGVEESGKKKKKKAKTENVEEEIPLSGIERIAWSQETPAQPAGTTAETEKKKKKKKREAEAERDAETEERETVSADGEKKKKKKRILEEEEGEKDGDTREEEEKKKRKKNKGDTVEGRVTNGSVETESKKSKKEKKSKKTAGQ